MRKSGDDYVHTRHYPDESLNASTIEGYNMIRKIRRAVRRAVSKHPHLFYHEEPHIRDLKEKVDDLEDLEARADMVAHHMVDKFPSDFAGDSSSQRDDVSTISRQDREAKENIEDEKFFSLFRPHKPALSKGTAEREIIERHITKKLSRRLKLEEQVKSSVTKSIEDKYSRRPDGKNGESQ